VKLFDNLRKKQFTILAYGLNNVCHQSVPMLEAVYTDDLDDLVNELNVLKLELLDAMPELLNSLVEHKFPEAKGAEDEEGEESDPEEMKEFYENVEEILNEQMKTDANSARWRTLFTDLIDTHEDLVDALAP